MQLTAAMYDIWNVMEQDVNEKKDLEESLTKKLYAFSGNEDEQMRKAGK